MRRFYAENKGLAGRIEGFAVESLRRLKGEAPFVPSDGDGDVKLDENGEIVKAEDTVMEKAAKKEDVENGENVREWKEEDVIRHLEVFLALCSRKHELLVQ